MILNRFGAVLTVLAVVLSACGSQNGATATSAKTSPTAPSAAVACGGRSTLKASGSTAQENAVSRFTKAFEHACPGQSLNYTANGSGAGINEFLDGRTDFGGSDSPLSKSEYARSQQRCGSPAWNLPMVFGPIAMAYNIGGIDSLVLDGPTAAKVFNGAITSWNDPAIAALNPGVALPAEAIRVVFRSDESGTSDNFQRYLDTASDGAWGKGAGKTFNGVGQGAQGSAGVVAAVKGSEGSITYVEWSFAQAQHLNVVKVVTSAGPEPVAIGADSVGKTISSAWFTREGNDLAFDTISFYRPNQPGAYPIVLATYEIVCSKYPDPQVGAAVRAFLQSASGTGQLDLAEHGYVPVPDGLRGRLVAAVDAVS
ncbi:phosphate ABC transporter substrate-binding protein PstS [Mycobacterium asiaticum]|uniref:Phosphate-binding protein n=1 Tax=Mycobacterium asiaticum TaxID=1790 RepID=A0A1A3NPE0_MYCAS|nr:phosphate ABC transporter substrate-binding protein PstS [Mycobacterium asiaticum]OBK22949.1 phosphate ABC transporter substrate-binding protein PstS [Mycobacterium asiaticum]